MDKNMCLVEISIVNGDFEVAVSIKNIGTVMLNHYFDLSNITDIVSLHSIWQIFKLYIPLICSTRQ